MSWWNEPVTKGELFQIVVAVIIIGCIELVKRFLVLKIDR